VPATDRLDVDTEAFMIRWIGVALSVAASMFDGSAAIDRAAAAPLYLLVQTPADAPIETSARPRARHTHPADRSQDQLYYIDRPRYYTPAPFVPFNYGYVVWPRVFWWP
jgi:hypothetical protein